MIWTRRTDFSDRRDERIDLAHRISKKLAMYAATQYSMLAVNRGAQLTL